MTQINHGISLSKSPMPKSDRLEIYDVKLK